MRRIVRLALVHMTACAALGGAGCSGTNGSLQQAPGSDSSAAVDTTVSGKFTPPDGQTLLIAGQTRGGLESYKASFRDPGGVTFYVTPMLQSTGPSFRGAPDWYKTGYGDQDLDYINQAFPNSALAVGVWMGQAIESDIAYGEDIQKTYLQGTDTGAQMKANLGVIIDTLKATNRPVFLRLGYEAEGMWNGYYPDAYRKVWAYVHGLIRDKGATNIAMVWQIASWCGDYNGQHPFVAYWPRDQGSLYPGLDAPWHDAQERPREANAAAWDDWYPGDDLVDWVAFSYFDQWKVCNSNGTAGLAKLQEAVDYLRSKGKPIMVAESSPRGFDLKNGSLFVDAVQHRESGLQGDQIWSTWYQPFFDFLGQNKQIRAVAYINDDWELYSHWHCDPNNLSSCAEGYWGDAQLSDSAAVADRWRATVEQSGKFLLGGDGMFGQLRCWSTRSDPSTCDAKASGDPGPGAGGGQSGAGQGGGQSGGDHPTATGTVPGVVASSIGPVSKGQVITVDIDAQSAREYSFRVSGTSPASQLITTTVDGASQTNATAETSGGVIITSPAFNLAAGRHTARFTIEGDGISISAIEGI